MPPRKTKPAALKVLEGRGNGRDAGGRKIKQPPPFKNLPPQKPSTLSADAAELWDEVIDEFTRLDLLREVDGGALESMCESWARYRTAVRMRQANGIVSETAQGISVAPWVRVEESSGKEFRAWCNEFGMTPAAAMKLAGKGDDDGTQSPFGADSSTG